MNSKGWKQVFKFTFVQTAKSKSFKVSTIIICVVFALIILGINFLPGIIDNSGMFKDEKTFAVKNAYILDNSGINPPTDFSSVEKETGIKFTAITNAEFDEKSAEVNKSEEGTILIELNNKDGAINVNISRPKSENVINKGNCQDVFSVVRTAVENAKLKSLGISESDYNFVKSEVISTITVAGEPPANDFANVLKMIIPMVTSLVLFVLIISYGQMIAQAIATEKASRVMELLLTSIRPLAIIIGKIISMLVIVFFQIAIIGVVTGGVLLASLPFGLFSTIQNQVATGNEEAIVMAQGMNEVFANFNLGTILCVVVIFILGFLFFALISGLAGACVSRMEDLPYAVQPLALIGVLGFYLAYFPALTLAEGESNFLLVFSRYFPVSSPFALPAAILTGEMQLWEAGIAIAVLALMVVLMAVVVAKVYEAIILHTGSRIKFTQIFKMAGKTK